MQHPLRSLTEFPQSHHALPSPVVPRDFAGTSVSGRDLELPPSRGLYCLPISSPRLVSLTLEYKASCCVHTCMCVRAYTPTHPHTPTFFCDLNSSGLQNTQGGVGSDQNILKHNSTELVKRSSCVEADGPIVEVKPSLSLGDINANNNSGKPTI